MPVEGLGEGEGCGRIASEQQPLVESVGAGKEAGILAGVWMVELGDLYFLQQILGGRLILEGLDIELISSVWASVDP